MLNQFAVEIHHVTSRPVSFPPHPIPEGLLRQAFVSPCRREGPPSIWDTHGKSGNVFANPPAFSSAPYPQELHQKNSSSEEPLHSSTVEKSGKQKDQDLRCQSGPSAKNSVILSGGGYSKNYGPDQQRLQISDLHFDKFLTPATFACWKIRFKSEVCTCSQFPTEAMQWIKEVEMVDSVDDLKSSCSVRGIRMPDFEVLDARIASALNKISQNSHFKRRISLEEQKAQKQNRVLRGRQIAYFIYDYFRVTGSQDMTRTMPTYSLSVYNCSSKITSESSNKAAAKVSSNTAAAASASKTVAKAAAKLEKERQNQQSGDISIKSSRSCKQRKQHRRQQRQQQQKAAKATTRSSQQQLHSRKSCRAAEATAKQQTHQKKQHSVKSSNRRKH